MYPSLYMESVSSKSSHRLQSFTLLLAINKVFSAQHNRSQVMFKKRNKRRLRFGIFRYWPNKNEIKKRQKYAEANAQNITVNVYMYAHTHVHTCMCVLLDDIMSGSVLRVYVSLPLSHSSLVSVYVCARSRTFHRKVCQ